MISYGSTINSALREKGLALCLLIPTLLLFNDIPFWAFASSLAFWIYRLVLDQFGWKAPSRFMTGFFSLIFFAATYFSFKSMLGRDASSTFLVLLLSLKILEYKNENDNGLLILIGFYLITVKYLYSSDFVWFSAGLPVLILLIYFLLPFNFRSQNPKYAGIYLIRSLFLSLPMGLFLFFYFPRFSTNSFFQMESDHKIQGVGFTDTLDPGSVSSLVQNDEIVFRAEFKNLNPSVNNLYWRGSVLTKQKGMRWERDSIIDQQLQLTRPFPSDKDNKLEFVQVTLDPTHNNWIFSLEHTKMITSDRISISKSILGNYFADSIIDTRVTYRFTFDPSLTYPQSLYEKNLYNKKANYVGINEKNPLSKNLKKFLSDIKSDTQSSEDVVSKFSEFLVKENFQYTIEPGDQGHLSLEDFLFKTKKGFCEHFASSLAIILNYLNIPARVITGFHGGEYNPLGHFWTIRQRDAHAWIEYIDSQNQWRRFDPTAVIAPMRITEGSRYFETLTSNNVWLSSFDKKGVSQSIMNQIEYFFENVNFHWNYMFVNFDLEKQKAILQQLDLSLTEATIFGLFSILIISLSLSWLLRSRKKMPRSQKIFSIINEHMKQFHLEKGETEGPLTWKKRILEAFPSKEKELHVLLDCYLAEAYQDRFSKHNFKRAKQILEEL